MRKEVYRLFIIMVVVYSILHHFYCVRFRSILASKVRFLPQRWGFLLLNWLFRVLIPLLLTIGLGVSPLEIGYNIPLDCMKASLLTTFLAFLNIFISFTLVRIATEFLKEEKALRKVKRWPSNVNYRDFVEGFLWDFLEEAFYRGFVFMGLRLFACLST